MELKSLTQRIKCVEAESRCLRMFLVSLVYSSMHLGVPFIAPRQLGAVGGQLGRPYFPSVGWCTGQSGAPPDIPCSLSGAVSLPNLAQLTVEDLEPLAHRTRSGAHRTVPVPHLTVGLATRHAQIAWPTVGPADRWLTGQSGVSPDSLVNYSRTLLTSFPRAATSPQTTHRTVRCTTGQSGDL